MSGIVNFKADKTYDKKMIVEDEIVRVYVNNEKVLNNRIYSAAGNDRKINIEGTSAELSDIEIYRK